jgi:hypothetical protein
MRVAPPGVAHPSVAIPSNIPTTSEQILPPATDTPAHDQSLPPQSSSRLQLVASVMIFLLSLLYAGYLLLVSQSGLLAVFCLGVAVGIGVPYLVNNLQPEPGSGAQGSLSNSALPMLIILPITSLLFILMFALLLVPFDAIGWFFRGTFQERSAQILAFFNGLLFAASGSQIWQSIQHWKERGRRD